MNHAYVRIRADRLIVTRLSGGEPVESGVPGSIRRIATDQDRELAWEFFVFFSRFEYALKRTPCYLTGNESHAQPNWDRFGSDYDREYAARATDASHAASAYFKEDPPRRQIVGENGLAWSDPLIYKGGPELVWLLLMIRTVRNNLFHGGKFPLIPIAEPSRDARLLQHSLAVLSACLDLDREVRRRFEESFE